MDTADIRTEWEGASAGWARWDPTIAAWLEPATVAMLDMAGVGAGVRVLDVASGSGGQTLRAAQRVGPQGHVVASDIAETMLRHVKENARAAGLSNVTTLAGPAEELDVAAESFDAVICRLGLMLFIDPAKALHAVRPAMRPSGKMAVVVFTTPAANPLLAQARQILLRHAGNIQPTPGQSGLFALGAPGVIERLFANNGFVRIEQRTIAVPLRMPSAAQALKFMQEAVGALRAIVSHCPPAVRMAAWGEVAETLKTFESATGFVAPAEVLVAAGSKPA
jgi:SAM-dependent methyltransferase